MTVRQRPGITPAAFAETLGDSVELLTTNVDRAGLTFVSTMEHKTFPFPQAPAETATFCCTPLSLW